MGTSVIQYGFFNAVGDSSAAGIAKRQQCEMQRSWLETERASFIPTWRDCNDFILPRRARFFVTDVNKGDRRTGKIIDSTGTLSVRTMVAGMQTGITNPARPWFQIATPNTEIAERADVKEWLRQVRDGLLDTFGKSNVYDTLALMYADLGAFGTAAFSVLDDAEDVIRCYDFPIGSYCIANDDKLRVRTFSRLFRMSVSQVVQWWGEIDPKTGRPNFLDGRPTTISTSVQNLWRNGSQQAWVDIVHFVQPNVSYDGEKIDPHYKRFESVYYEYGTNGAPHPKSETLGLLAREGFDEYPVMAARWEKNSEDVYGTNSPGITALGDIKQLQTVEKRFAQGLEIMLKPPVGGPGTLRNTAISLLPNGVTYGAGNPTDGLRPIYQVPFGQAIGPTREWQMETRERIKEAFYVQLFLSITDAQHDMTAKEVEVRDAEKMMVIGPVLSRLNADVYDQLIERTFNIKMRRGLIPPPPAAMQGQPLKVEYISIMHAAQQAVSLGAIERFVGFAGQVAQFSPGALDNVNFDQVMQQYGTDAGVEPRILNSPEEVAATRHAQQQQAQAAQAAENAPKVARAAKDLSQADVGGQNALQALLNSKNAHQTIGATASPPSSLVS